MPIILPIFNLLRRMREVNQIEMRDIEGKLGISDMHLQRKGSLQRAKEKKIFIL
jgi:hypothetical protein